MTSFFSESKRKRTIFAVAFDGGERETSTLWEATFEYTVAYEACTLIINSPNQNARGRMDGTSMMNGVLGS